MDCLSRLLYQQSRLSAEQVVRELEQFLEFASEREQQCAEAVSLAQDEISQLKMETQVYKQKAGELKIPAEKQALWYKARKAQIARALIQLRTAQVAFDHCQVLLNNATVMHARVSSTVRASTEVADRYQRVMQRLDVRLDENALSRLADHQADAATSAEDVLHRVLDELPAVPPLTTAVVMDDDAMEEAESIMNELMGEQKKEELPKETAPVLNIPLPIKTPPVMIPT